MYKELLQKKKKKPPSINISQSAPFSLSAGGQTQAFTNLSTFCTSKLHPQLKMAPLCTDKRWFFFPQDISFLVCFINSANSRLQLITVNEPFLEQRPFPQSYLIHAHALKWNLVLQSLRIISLNTGVIISVSNYKHFTLLPAGPLSYLLGSHFSAEDATVIQWCPKKPVTLPILVCLQPDWYIQFLPASAGSLETCRKRNTSWCYFGV